MNLIALVTLLLCFLLYNLNLLLFLHSFGIKEALVPHPLITVNFAHISRTMIREYGYYLTVFAEFSSSVELF